MRDEEVLLRIKPNFPAIEELSRVLDLLEYYAFSRQTRVAGRDAAARMFAPLYGIPEESATGMAAGALACYLHDRLSIGRLDTGKSTIVIELDW